MKKEMVINVQMHSEKSRSKAMQLAASAGVDSVKVDGEKNQLVVVGEVDPVILTAILRKKIGHSDIVKVADVKKDDEAKSKETKVEPNFAWYRYTPAPPVVVYEDPCNYSNPNVCSIL
ncbi:heavy metal-associated isoprenylated plant protein 12-like [Phoenix dactylifera]|uniref:Heavy metal-associated isoprenylated plant protein 12-like n=1 Tax=Phoenix dactylifera TaxID=42345 RepID=A0A8B7CYW9_PHODC|nr:heavy metal-associated isoprenylated plant protein 12-like [Phoenix dactylifera]